MTKDELRTAVLNELEGYEFDDRDGTKRPLTPSEELEAFGCWLANKYIGD